MTNQRLTDERLNSMVELCDRQIEYASSEGNYDPQWFRDVRAACIEIQERRAAAEPCTNCSRLMHDIEVGSAELDRLRARNDELEGLIEARVEERARQIESINPSSAEPKAELPYHLQMEAPPLCRCSVCGRMSWAQSEVGKTCGMRQPNGTSCRGQMLPPENRQAEPTRERPVCPEEAMEEAALAESAAPLPPAWSGGTRDTHAPSTRVIGCPHCRGQIDVTHLNQQAEPSAPIVEAAFELMNDAPLVAHADDPKSAHECSACSWLAKVQEWYAQSGLPENRTAEPT